jgi:predicted RNase H-like HicB family nuclease
LGVTGLVDDAHAALAQLLQNLEMGDGLTGHPAAIPLCPPSPSEHAESRVGDSFSPRIPASIIPSKSLTIELDREVDGRWIAEVPELNVLLSGDSKQDARQRPQSAAREIVRDRIAHGELPSDSANTTFDIAA